MYCENCGIEIGETDTCPSCGNPTSGFGFQDEIVTVTDESGEVRMATADGVVSRWDSAKISGRGFLFIVMPIINALLIIIPVCDISFLLMMLNDKKIAYSTVDTLAVISVWTCAFFIIAGQVSAAFKGSILTSMFANWVDRCEIPISKIIKQSVMIDFESLSVSERRKAFINLEIIRDVEIYRCDATYRRKQILYSLLQALFYIIEFVIVGLIAAEIIGDMVSAFELAKEEKRKFSFSFTDNIPWIGIIAILFMVTAHILLEILVFEHDLKKHKMRWTEQNLPEYNCVVNRSKK